MRDLAAQSTRPEPLGRTGILWRDSFYRGFRVPPGHVSYVRVSAQDDCYVLYAGFTAAGKTSVVVADQPYSDTALAGALQDAG
jgi:hypothetical protein